MSPGFPDFALAKQKTIDYIRGVAFGENILHMVSVAQLVVAPGCGLGGRGFKSHRSPH